VDIFHHEIESSGRDLERNEGEMGPIPIGPRDLFGKQNRKEGNFENRKKKNAIFIAPRFTESGVG